MNYKMVTYILGWIMIFEAIFMLVPSVTAIVYGESTLWYFLGTALICFIFGRLLTFKKRQNRTLYSRDGFVIVAMSWIILSIFGSFPLVFTKVLPSFIDALFEE